ncbi:MAG TPA: NACHT domain-containing protein [Pseudonocardia sp.]|uniref:NACHT domain-containing protein n=1 Tax=Pseudonocardia sp. TaxID=60912 RepID=UPI002F3EAE73
MALHGVIAGGNVTVVQNGRPAADRELGAAERTAYLAALTARYRVLDLAALTPDSEDDHVPVMLSEVFVPQTVRADPPPVELPRDLWRRLVEAGDIGKDELPKELEDADRELIAKAREAHAAHPPRRVAEVLTDSKQRLVVVLGDPGAGKSSLLRYIALALASDQAPPEWPAVIEYLPVLVELRAYASPTWRTGRWADGTLLDFLDQMHAQQGLGLPREVLAGYLRGGGRAVVMFDGLDELFDRAQRDETVQRIVAFSRQFPQARVIVTSRVVGYRRGALDAAGFSLHTLQDLDTEQVDEFVTRWYTIACRGDTAEATARTTRLLAAIARSASARDLAGNPMLLTILAVIGRRRELPKERHRVYHHAVEVLTQHWDLNRAVRDTRVEMAYIDEEDKREMLRRIARRMQEGRDGIAGNHIHRDELLAEFRGYLQQRYQQPADQAKIVAKAILEQFRYRNFILSRFGPGIYGFVHRAFLEYCCADEIVYRFKETKELGTEQLVTEVFGEHATDPAWQEVLLLLAGMIHEKFLGQVIDHLLDLGQALGVRLDSETAGRHWLLALRCLAEARSVGDLSEQGVRIVTGLLEHLSSTRQSMGALEEMLEPPAWELIEAAIPVLRELGSQLPGRELYLDWFGRSPAPRLPAARSRLALIGRVRQFSQTGTAIAGALHAGSDRLRAILLRRIDDEDDQVSEAAVHAFSAGWPDSHSRA